MDAGRLIQSMLPVNHTVAGEVRDEALTTTSYASRERPDARPRRRRPLARRARPADWAG